MEKLGREMELAYLRGARHAVFGHEPVVAFHLLWENEIRNVRGLCAGKRAGLAEADLRDFIAYAS
jgi:vacuolar-type H+-ATPase subunit C/Vma6